MIDSLPQFAQTGVRLFRRYWRSHRHRWVHGGMAVLKWPLCTPPGYIRRIIRSLHRHVTPLGVLKGGGAKGGDIPCYLPFPPLLEEGVYSMV